MIFGSDIKTAEKGHTWKESGVTTWVEVGFPWRGNDKNNIIPDEVLSYF